MTVHERAFVTTVRVSPVDLLHSSSYFYTQENQEHLVEQRAVNPWADHYEEANDRHVQTVEEEEEEGGEERRSRDDDERHFDEVNAFQEVHYEEIRKKSVVLLWFDFAYTTWSINESFRLGFQAHCNRSSLQMLDKEKLSHVRHLDGRN